MRKSIFVLIVFMAYPAFSQVVSGTIVVFNFTKDQLVVAADSRGVSGNTGTPEDSECKIAAFRHQFVFVSVGGVRYTKHSVFDIIESWDNTELAEEAISTVRKRDSMDEYMDAITTDWANTVAVRWNYLCNVNRLDCVKETQASNGILTSGIFFGVNGLLLRGGIISFDTTKLFNPVVYATGKKLAQCWPCGQKHGGQVCAAGSHFDVAAKFCSERGPNTKLRLRTALRKADQNTKLAVKIVEMTIDAYEKVPGDVGGKVDAITLSKSGRMTWNSLKHDCREDQD